MTKFFSIVATADIVYVADSFQLIGTLSFLILSVAVTTYIIRMKSTKYSQTIPSANKKTVVTGFDRQTVNAVSADFVVALNQAKSKVKDQMTNRSITWKLSLEPGVDKFLDEHFKFWNQVSSSFSSDQEKQNYFVERIQKYILVPEAVNQTFANFVDEAIKIYMDELDKEFEKIRIKYEIQLKDWLGWKEYLVQAGRSNRT
jgi:hypothetical protein